MNTLFHCRKQGTSYVKNQLNSTKIDLIIREAGIGIEVKMIKSTDKDENKFVAQLKTLLELTLKPLSNKNAWIISCFNAVWRKYSLNTLPLI